jgi:hypothetical protein
LFSIRSGQSPEFCQRLVSKEFNPVRLLQLKNLVLYLGLAGSVLAEPPVLERYTFHLGWGNNTSSSPGAELRFTDRFFGSGTARSRLTLVEQSSTSDRFHRPMMLFLHVDREVSQDEVVFALLVFRVEIHGYDAQGALVYRQDLPGFTFGDSAPGRWYESLAGVPTGLSQLVVTFFGNYE